MHEIRDPPKVQVGPIKQVQQTKQVISIRLRCSCSGGEILNRVSYGVGGGWGLSPMNVGKLIL